MRNTIKNFLYDNPELYDSLYTGNDDAIPKMCRRIFEVHLASPPSSILDVACGTGRDIFALRKSIDDCTAIDYLPQMINYAKSKNSDICFLQGDMKSVRLERTFDIITCFGSAILYALTNAELDQVFSSFSAHSHEGSLLIFDLRNASSFYDNGCKRPLSGAIRKDDFSAEWNESYTLDRRNQLLIRSRTWTTSLGEKIDDYVEFRLLFPLEIERLLDNAGFKLLSMSDNLAFGESDLSGPVLYIVAQRKG